MRIHYSISIISKYQPFSTRKTSFENFIKTSFYFFQMTKIEFSTKYLSKQHLIMGIMASVLVILFLTFQFTNVEMQNKETHTAEDSRSVNGDINKVDWKTVDLKSKSIPDTIKNNLDSDSITDNTVELQVLCILYNRKFFYIHFMTPTN